MKDDPIVAEIRQRRREILESYDGDFAKMSNDVMERQWRSGHKVASRPKRKPILFVYSIEWKEPVPSTSKPIIHSHLS